MTVRKLLLGSVFALVGAVTGASADTITTTYGAPGVQTASSIVVLNANTLGVENFDTQTIGNSGFTTNYGTGSAITGVYSAGANITPADQYGGAGGIGQQIKAMNDTTGYSISLSTSGIPGVNYFGYWLSALDAGNELNFYRSGLLVGSYDPSDLVAALGSCPDATNAYCGNPTANFLGQDPNEPFAFVNFVDTTGFFDEIQFVESPTVGDYESDNHTVAYCSNATACITGTGIGVPEPITLSLFGAGLAGAAAMRRRKKANKA